MRRLNPTTIAMIAGAALVLLIAILLLVRRGDSNQDKLTGEGTSASATADPQERCASARTYDLIKRDLFRRAAQVRGSDQAAFDSLAAYATIRMDRPVMEREEDGLVHCSGALTVDLPPGVAVVGGRRTLSADVDYAVQSAADRSGDVLTLSNADAIITPLATLVRTSAGSAEMSPSPAPDAAEPVDNRATDPTPQTQAPPVPIPAPPPPPAIEPGPTRPAPSASARPSFNCANARTRGERAVCGDSGLASLDRQMAAQFNRAMANASPGEREMLVRSRGRFLSFRDRCGSDSCIADAYRGRIAEISDIMSGRWEPSR
jgi:uncharacterized protein YecT (DUF1311 family)